MEPWKPDRVLMGDGDDWWSPYTTQQYRASWPYFEGKVAGLGLLDRYITAAEITTAAIRKMMMVNA